MKIITSIGIISLIFLVISKTLFEILPKNDFFCLILSSLVFLNFFDVDYNKKNKSLIIKTTNHLF
jgi:hypothetical protein